MVSSLESAGLHLLHKAQNLFSPSSSSTNTDVESIRPILTSLAAIIIAYGIWALWSRPRIHKNSPKLWRAYEWPLLGSAPSFYNRRRDYVMQGHKESKTGNFSFLVGKKHVVAVAGPAGRKTFYESRGLNFSAGFVELLAGMPFTQEADATEGDWPKYFNKTLVTMLRTEMLVKKLPVLCNDVRAFCDRLASESPSISSPEWSVTDVFDTVYSLLTQLLSRIVGATEIAKDIETSKKVVRIFERFEKSNSTTGIIFPWLRVFTPAYVTRMVLGTVLYLKFDRIIKDRKRTGRREDDALQYLLDLGTPMETIIKFQISAVWAALLTTGANGTWLLVILASNPEWKARCREEIDGAVARHRTSPGQSVHDVLESLTLEQWETEFPVVDVCLKEAMRVAMPGAVFRKNTSGFDIPIGDTGEVIPAGSFATYIQDEVHMDDKYYPDPTRFDPGRYERNEGGKGEPHTFVGWGSGMHPCLGSKLAKLEIFLMVACVLGRFDVELSDKDGNAVKEPPSMLDRNEHTVAKSKTPIYLRYRERKL